MPAACPIESEQPSAARRTVLVIDDDVIHRTIICHVADRAGFAAIGAATVADAEVLLGSHVFDCITLDMRIGACSGHEVLHSLSAIGVETPVIVLSSMDGAAGRDAVDAARRLGLDALEPLRKPIDAAVLRARLETVARRPALAAWVAAPTVAFAADVV